MYLTFIARIYFITNKVLMLDIFMKALFYKKSMDRLSLLTFATTTIQALPSSLCSLHITQAQFTTHKSVSLLLHQNYDFTSFFTFSTFYRSSKSPIVAPSP